jgi:hypothetical protein
VRAHVFDYVEVNYPRLGFSVVGAKMYYVDPRTGLLRINKQRRSR